jgi:hypothetical protein
MWSGADEQPAKGKMMKTLDRQYEDQRLTKVEDFGDSWAITGECGTLCIPKTGPTPKEGDTARYYGRGFGFPVRGVDINGVEVYYHTEQQWREKTEREQNERDAKQRRQYDRDRESFTVRINALPSPFQKRLFQFRERNPDYGWKFEGYELTCSETAAIIASACERREGGTVEDWFGKYRAAAWEFQLTMTGPLSEGLSGNMHGFATRHAWLYLNSPDLIASDHGALCILVGCEGFKACDAAILRAA